MSAPSVPARTGDAPTSSSCVAVGACAIVPARAAPVAAAVVLIPAPSVKTWARSSSGA